MIRQVLEAINEKEMTPEQLYRGLEKAGWEVVSENKSPGFSSRIWKGPYDRLNIRTVETYEKIQEIYIVIVPERLALDNPDLQGWELLGDSDEKVRSMDYYTDVKQLLSTARQMAAEAGL